MFAATMEARFPCRFNDSGQEELRGYDPFV
jgi:hypothetical protein